MAIYLSRIKRALNVGSKSITNNGTYYASADGYDGYDEVTVNVSGGSATPITPSNANPVALSSGVAVEPTANGYAIQSYDNITPPSSPQAISSGDILKMIGNGYVIDTYSTATPSDSTPPQLSQGGIYIPTSNGYLYENQQGGSTETVLWTNNSPTSAFSAQTVTLSQSIDNFDYIKITYRGGTSNANEVHAIYPVSDIRKMSTSNLIWGAMAGVNSSDKYGRYISYVSDTQISFSTSGNMAGSGTTNVATIPTQISGISVALPPSVGNVKVGAFTASTSTTTTVDIGFKPKYLMVMNLNSSNTGGVNVYDEDALGANKSLTATTAVYVTNKSLPSTTLNTIASISNTGFTYNKVSSGYTTCYYFAIG